MVAFIEVPSSNLEPAAFYEQDGSRALAAQAPDAYHVLLIGFRQSSGTATSGQIKSITAELDGDAYFGARSQLAQATRAFKRVNKTARVSAMGISENSGGTAATCTFPLTGTSTEAGTLRVRIGDQRVSISIATSTAAATAAAALETAINATERMMWTAVNATATNTLTHIHKGESGNGFTIEVELIPAGLACTVTQPTNGATNPTMSTAIALFEEDRYDCVVTCMTDATSVAALEVEMLRRIGATVKLPGFVMAAVRGSHGTLTTYGDARNSRVSCVMGAGLAMTPPWIWAAQSAARNAQRCDTQPNLPRKGMTLPDCEGAKKFDRFSHTQRNLLLADGISTHTIDQSGAVMISRLITTYQVNTSSLSDATYRSMEDFANLAGIYVELLTLGSRYENYILMDDESIKNVEPGVPVMSPLKFKGIIIGWYDGLVRRGRARDVDGFAETLYSAINTLDPERLDMLMSTRLARGLVTLAMKNDFLLY